MLHFFFQEGHLPGIPDTFGGGQIVETDEAMTRVISVKPMFPLLLPPPPPHFEGRSEAEKEPEEEEKPEDQEVSERV